MDDQEVLARQHLEATRRYFLQAASAWGVSSILPSVWGKEGSELSQTIADLGFYLTKSEDFYNVERHKPLGYQLPKEQRLELGLERETWQLEVSTDPESDAKIRNPLTNEKGTSLGFGDLMQIAETKEVSFLKVMTCNNLPNPLGMGLWTGIPLREVIWLAKPDKNIRRVFYRGFHNDDPKQIFQSSLSIGRVLEDPPGEMPVILCYEFNGRPLTGERGGPVRIIVPDAYGFKSVKWIQEIYLTNNHQANDTYAKQNNDVESPMKSFARISNWPKEGRTIPANQPIPVAGLVQSGMSGVSKVQYWIKPENEPPPEGDRYFEAADWKDAEILPPPEGDWGERVTDLPELPKQFNEDGTPREWPLRNTLAHWAVLIPGLPTGTYELRCRTVDANGIAQPMPRPFSKSGGNAIQKVIVKVT